MKYLYRVIDPQEDRIIAQDLDLESAQETVRLFTLDYPDALFYIEKYPQQQ